MIEKNIPTTRRRGRYTSGIMALVGVLMFFTPIITGLDMDDGGGALILVGITMAISGLALFPLMYKRDKMYNNLMNETDRLAYWEYSKEAWNRANEIRLLEGKEKAKVMIFVIDGLIFIITTIFAISDPDVAGPMFIVMGSIAVLLTIVAIVAPKITYAVAQKQTPIVMIGRKGALYGSELHYWNGIMGQFKTAIYNQKENVLRISYLYIGGTAPRQTYELIIEVPSGQEKQAKSVVFELEHEYRKVKS